MEAVIKNGKLIITMPLVTPTASRSGKTMVVASTNGNKATTAVVNHGGVDRALTIGVNAYFKQ